MTTASHPAPTWHRSLTYPALEFGPLDLPILSGSLPPQLSGSLYRNGPARLERGGQRVGHWFDGDGAVLGIHVQGSRARGIYRYVKTKGYQAESHRDRFLYGGYGMRGTWGRMVKNVANTSVLALSDRVLALWEAGSPHRLDPQSLETLGLETFADELGEGSPYSAHPKQDPLSGEIFNFGVSVGRRTTLHLTVLDGQGRLQRQRRIGLQGIPLIHDAVLAGPYWVFCIPPVRLNLWPVLLGWRSYSECLQWQPQQGTHLVIVDRESLEVVAQGQADPWYQWHFGNGWVNEAGEICIYLVKYADFTTNQYLQQVPSGTIKTYASGFLHLLRLDPQTAKVLELTPVVQPPCEFPTVLAEEVGQPSQGIYFATHRPGARVQQDFFGALGSWDPQRELFVLRDLGPGRYPSEPVLARDPQGGRWLWTVVFDGEHQSSEVWLFAADHLHEEPVCRLGLPGVVPASFHGTWRGDPA